MMKFIKYLAAIIAFASMTGCAHQILVSPDLANINRDAGSKPIDKSVGYYISPADKMKAVTTAGGGGDKVTYYPYKDIETAFYKMLSNVFKDVTLLQSPTGVEISNKQKISLIFTPEIDTNSSSSSPFTWPPTQFTMYLTCKIYDSDGKYITKKMVTGEGHAEYEEFKVDFSLAAKRAAQDALLKMQKVLLSSPELRN